MAEIVTTLRTDPGDASAVVESNMEKQAAAAEGSAARQIAAADAVETAEVSAEQSSQQATEEAEAAKTAAREAAAAAAIAAQIAIEQAQYDADQETRVSIETLSALDEAAAFAGEKLALLGEKAELGGRGVLRAASVAKVALLDYQTAVDDARANGDPVPAEALLKLEELQIEYQRCITRAAQFKAAQRDVTIEMKAAEVAAGDFVGTFRGVGDILGALSPRVGSVVENLTGLGLGGFVAYQGLKLVAEGLLAAGTAAGDAYAKEIEKADEAARVFDGTNVMLAQNLKNILAKEGYDVAGKSLGELAPLEADHIARLREAAAASGKVADEIVGNVVALNAETEALYRDIEAAKARVAVNLEGVRQRTDGAVQESALNARVREEVTKLVAVYENAGQIVPENLLKIRKELNAVTVANDDSAKAELASTNEKIAGFQRYGLDVPTYLLKAKKSLEDVAAAEDRLSVSQGMNSVQLANEAAKVDAMVAKYEKAGDVVPPKLAEIQRQLHGMAEASKDAGDAIQAMGDKIDKGVGIKTPEDIKKAVDAWLAYGSASEAASQATGKASDDIIKKARGLMDALDELPQAQKIASQVEVAALANLIDAYDQAASATERARLAGEIAAASAKLNVKSLAEDSAGAAASTRDAIDRTATSLQELGAKFKEAGDAAKEGGEVSLAAMQAVIKEAESLRAEVNKLPADQRAAAEAMLAPLEALAAKYRENGAVAAAAMGVQTVDAIKKATTELENYVTSIGGAGNATHEEAEKIKQDALKILTSIEELPPAQRKAVADQAKALEGLDAEYSKVAAHQKSLVIDIEAAEKAALASVTNIVKGFQAEAASLLATLKQIEDATKQKQSDDIASLRKQIADIEGQGSTSAADLNNLSDLRQKLSDAEAAASDLGKTVSRFGDDTQAAKLTVDQTNASVLTLIKTLQDNKDGYQALDDTQKGAIQHTIENLRDAGQQGGATADQIRSAFESVGNALQSTGADTSELQGKFGALASDGVGNLKLAFDDLDKKQTDVKANLPGLQDQITRSNEAMNQTATTAKKAGGEMELAFKTAEGQVVKFKGTTAECNAELAKMVHTIQDAGYLLTGVGLGAGISSNTAPPPAPPSPQGATPSAS